MWRFTSCAVAEGGFGLGLERMRASLDSPGSSSRGRLALTSGALVLAVVFDGAWS